MLAGVGPFAIEQGLIAAGRRPDAGPHPHARIYPPRSRSRTCRRPAGASATTATHASTACPARHARSQSTSSTSPAHRAARCCRPATSRYVIEGIAGDLHRQRHAGGLPGGRPTSVCPAQESPAELEGNAELTKRVEAIRLAAGPHDEPRRRDDESVPKMSLRVAARARRRRSPPGRSSRTACTRRSACSARCRSRRRACCPGRWRTRSRPPGIGRRAAEHRGRAPDRLLHRHASRWTSPAAWCTRHEVGAAAHRPPAHAR